MAIWHISGGCGNVYLGLLSMMRLHFRTSLLLYYDEKDRYDEQQCKYNARFLDPAILVHNQKWSTIVCIMYKQLAGVISLFLFRGVFCIG